ncbi:MAG: MATE family efflux transporter [Polyangiaceae bacterium]
MTSGIDSGADLPAVGTAIGIRTATVAARLDGEIWAMAWPAILSFAVVNVVDIIDVALVGRLGRVTVAAWGYASLCVNLVETLLVAVGIGGVAIMARAIGARDPDRARRALAASMLIAVVVAGVGFGLAMTVPRVLLGWLNASPDIVAIAVPYLRLTSGSMILYAVAFMFECGLRACKNTRAPLAVGIVVMFVKTALSVLLVFGLLGLPRLGLVGAGIATVGAYGAGFVLFAIASRIAARSGAGVAFGPRDVLAMWGIVPEVLYVSLPAMGERLVMNIALLTYFTILATFGTAAIAAYSIGVRLLAISWVPGLGFAAAASTLVGQALGAGDAARARRIGLRSVLQALGLMSVLSVLFLFLRGPLARQFTDDVQVERDLVPFMVMLAFAQPFIGVHFTLGGVLRGAGDTVTPLIGAAIGNWVFRVPLAWLFSHAFGAHLVLVWAAVVVDHCSRLVINGAAFVRGRWARRLGEAVR